MRLSVIIPNYNYGRFLAYAVDSLLAQKTQPDEIIIVDDGSTDDSREIIESYGDRVIALFQPNGGQASAISAGFARATGDIICLLDSDDVFFPDKVGILKNLYAENPDAMWIFHDLKHMKPEEVADFSSRAFASPDRKMEWIDQRRNMIAGHLGYDAPATSGLSFRRDFISPLFPLPSARSIYISDHYIKFFAIASGRGLNVRETLGGQIIHDSNLYTGLAKQNATRARIFVHTANGLYLKLPSIRKFCTNLMSEGVACARHAGIGDELSAIISGYMAQLSASERLYLCLKAAAKYFLKFF